jgi:hypothetical protein
MERKENVTNKQLVANNFSQKKTWDEIDLVVPEKTKSKVWKYCRIRHDDKDKKEAYCLVCKSWWISWCGGTSNLKRHLQQVHNVCDFLKEDLKQPKLSIPPLEPNKRKNITSAIAKVIAGDLLPLSLVEKKYFKNLLSIAEPRYEMPSRQYFSKTVIPELYEKLCNELQCKWTIFNY